jgi:hypothetical protein
MANEERNEVNRREFLRKAAITGAVAWAFPVVQSVAASPAYAQTPAVCSPRGCQHSLGGASGGGCMSACQGSKVGGGGCGAACNNFCGPRCNCPGNFCRCNELCNPGNWSNCVYTGPDCSGLPCPC